MEITQSIKKAKNREWYVGKVECKDGVNVSTALIQDSDRKEVQERINDFIKQIKQ
jgi:hypothetical protein